MRDSVIFALSVVALIVVLFVGGWLAVKGLLWLITWLGGDL